MTALDRSAELLRRGAELRARSARQCTAAAETREKSRQVIADAADANRDRWWSAGPRARAAAGSTPLVRYEDRDAQPALRWVSLVRPPEVAGAVKIVGLVPEGRARRQPERPGTVPVDWQTLIRMSRESRARARATRDQILRGRSQREILHDSAFARLLAKQETLAVVEQAKGIIMAQRRCSPEEAFDLLRKASQRTNVKLRVLAAQIVGQTAASGEATPITASATRYLAAARARPHPGEPGQANGSGQAGGGGR